METLAYLPYLRVTPGGSGVVYRGLANHVIIMFTNTLSRLIVISNLKCRLEAWILHSQNTTVIWCTMLIKDFIIVWGFWVFLFSPSHSQPLQICCGSRDRPGGSYDTHETTTHEVGSNIRHELSTLDLLFHNNRNMLLYHENMWKDFNLQDKT